MLKEELGLTALARRLEKLLEDKASMAELILPVMKEIQYLNQAEQKALQQNLKQMEEQPALMRRKKKGDYLVGYRKYATPCGCTAMRSKTPGRIPRRNRLFAAACCTIWDAAYCPSLSDGGGAVLFQTGQ